MHLSRLRNARETLVPLARHRAELDRDSYGAGKLDLGAALPTTLGLAEAEVEALNREADVARVAVRLTITSGAERPCRPIKPCCAGAPRTWLSRCRPEDHKSE